MQAPRKTLAYVLCSAFTHTHSSLLAVLSLLFFLLIANDCAVLTSSSAGDLAAISLVYEYVCAMPCEHTSVDL